jgi:glyoxylase I family protein
MLTIRHLDHLVLRVTDLEAMMGFYTRVLGCPVEKVQADLGLYQLRAGSALIDLVPVDGPLGRKGGAAAGLEGRNLDHFCLRVEPFDAEAILAHLHTRPRNPATIAQAEDTRAAEAVFGTSCNFRCRLVAVQRRSQTFRRRRGGLGSTRTALLRGPQWPSRFLRVENRSVRAVRPRRSAAPPAGAVR